MRDFRAAECVKVLSAFGYEVEGNTPIRIVLARDGRRVFVPRHGPISEQELATILASAAIAEEQFFRMRDLEHAMRDSGVRRSSSVPKHAESAIGFSRILRNLVARRA